MARRLAFGDVEGVAEGAEEFRQAQAAGGGAAGNRTRNGDFGL
jgi:hypothetical protein